MDYKKINTWCVIVIKPKKIFASKIEALVNTWTKRMEEQEMAQKENQRVNS